MSIPPLEVPFAIVSHFPGLLLVDNAACELVRAHTQNAKSFEDFLQAIKNQGAPGPNSGWATLEPITLTDGRVAKNSRGETIYRSVLSQDTLQALPPLLAEVLQAVRSDAALEGYCWTMQQGIVPGVQVNSSSGSGWSLRSLSPRFGVGFPAVEFDSGTRDFTLRLNNVNPRHLAIYAEFLREGKPVAPENWVSRLPAGVASTFETAMAKYLSLVTPTTPIGGIPVPTGDESFALPLGSQAESVRLVFGNIGSGSWFAPFAALGTIVTALLDQAVPAVLVKAGGDHKYDSWFNSLLGDRDILASVMNAGQFLLDGSIADAPTLLAALAAQIDRLLLDAPLQLLHDAINKALGTDAVENAAPSLNWTWSTLGALLTSNSFPLASLPLLSGPPTFSLDLTPQMVVDLSVAVRPDPARGEWPDVADHYTVIVRDADGVAQSQSAPIPSAAPGVPLSARFSGIRAGAIAVEVALYAENGWLCGKGETLLDARLVSGNGAAVASVTIDEIVVPITGSTQYRHYRNLTFDAANNQYLWKRGEAPVATANSLDAPCNGTLQSLCAPIGLTLQERAGSLGYIWKASGQGLPTCGVGGRAIAVGYLFRNVGVVDPQAFSKTIPCSFIQQPYLVYDGQGDPKAARAGTGYNFFLDAQPDKLLLRSVALDETTPFDLVQSTSWGSLVEASMTKLVIHPAGYLAAINHSNARLEVLPLPATPLADGAAPVAALLAGAGTGNQAGLLDHPVALDVTPTGLILVLENGAGRLQALDLFGNPVPCFSNGSPFLPLRAENGVLYQDVAVSPSGFIYILSSIDGGAAPEDYRLDIYTAEGTFLARTTGISAARIAVDSWGRIYTLNYEAITGAEARTEPSLSAWIPGPPSSTGPGQA